MDDAKPSTTMLDLVGPLWSRDRALDALALTVTAFDDAVTAGDLLRLPASDDQDAGFYPVFQFVTTPSGSVQVDPALRVMLRAFAAHDPWTVATLLLTPAPELDDLTPLQAARAGYPEDRLRGFTDAIRAELGVAGAG